MMIPRIRNAKLAAWLITGGMLLGTGGTCVPENPFFLLGASTRALVFDTFTFTIASITNNLINGTIFGEFIEPSTAGAQ